jgi:hypothetical protein
MEHRQEDHPGNQQENRLDREEWRRGPAAGSSDGANPSSPLERAQSWGAEQAEPIKQKALGFAEEQKRVGAERLVDAAHAASRAADDLEGKLPYAAKCVRDAAAGLERASSAIKEHGIEEVPALFSKAARAQPLAVFGGAVLAGFLLSRFLKSSAAGLQTQSGSAAADRH